MRLTLFVLFCSITLTTLAQDSAQSQLLGKYKFPDGSVVTEVVVGFENGGLTMNSSAGTSVLELIKGDSFNIVSFNGTAVFKRNDAKKVIGVHVDASGYVLDGVKDGAAIVAGGLQEKEMTFAGPAVWGTQYLMASGDIPGRRKRNMISPDGVVE